MILTNSVGVAFAATLLSVSDAGAVLVFSEDGATNTFAFSQLSEESAKLVCEATGYERIPPALAATYALAKRELARTDALLAEGRIDAETAELRRRRIREALESRTKK